MNFEDLDFSYLQIGNHRYANPSVNLQNVCIRAETTCATIGSTNFNIPVDLVKLVVTPHSVTLPMGSTYLENQYFHEVVVPATPALTKLELEKMMSFQIIKRDMLREEHQNSLADIKTLNTIQSATFNAAYNTDNNLLVCAPTGAGKTLIALMCILRELTHYSTLQELKKCPYKIVYIAPMKALAAEIVKNMKQRLEPLGLCVREFTGDMHLYAGEIEETDVLVTTPEKYDAVTRRDTGEASLFQTVHLLIVDEVHLLNSDRGPVLEAIVARMFRLRAIKNSRLRVVGLSASLPNFSEIADFLHVKFQDSMFYFGWGFRPIPLKQSFIGTRNSRFKKHYEIANELCYAKTLEFIKQGKQVLIFVHSRAGTIETAKYIEKEAEKADTLNHFYPRRDGNYQSGLELLQGSRMKMLRSFFDVGMSVHHAGMLREDRILVEELFRMGAIKVLVSTATLAWGVNLPAYAVIIKGTRLYSPSKGTQVNMDLLDLQQMFGRAGRPQYDQSGEAIVITNQLELHLYLSLLQWKLPIQSQLHEHLVDHLNAEIVLNSVRSVEEGVDWLRHTFMYIRMKVDPKHYQVTSSADDRCGRLVKESLLILQTSKMIQFDSRTGKVSPTDIGRIASHTYINHATIRLLNEFLDTPVAKSLSDILRILAKANEFRHFKLRQEEHRELSSLCDMHCTDKPDLMVPECERKVLILMQTWICRGEIKMSSLYLDQVFTSQNVTRILRALFEIAVVKRKAPVSRLSLCLKKSIIHKLQLTDHPIFQMKYLGDDQYGYLISESGFSLFQLRKLDTKQLAKIVRDEGAANRIFKWLKSIPMLNTELIYQRPSPPLVQIELKVTPNFVWKKSVNHEEIEPFIVWVENPKTGLLYPPSRFSINCRQVERQEVIKVNSYLVLTAEEILSPPRLVVHVASEYWMGVDVDHIIHSENLAAPGGAEAVFRVLGEVK